MDPRHLFWSPPPSASACAMVHEAFYAMATVCLILVSGCTALPQGPSVSEPPIAYAWPIAQCPVDVKADQQIFDVALGGALASAALGEASSTLFGIPSVIFSQAAKADQAGYTVSSTNARYYYTDSTNPNDRNYVDPATRNQLKARLAPPACYVVAVYKSASVRNTKPTSWCMSGSDFERALPMTCKAESAAVLDSLSLLEPLPNAPAGQVLTTKDIRVPDLYVEIGFDGIAEVTANTTSPIKSVDTKALKASIVLPKAKALWYPNALLARASRKNRALGITISVSQVAAFSATPDGNNGEPAPPTADVAGSADGAKDKPGKAPDSKPDVASNDAAAAGLLNVNFTLNLNAVEPGHTNREAPLAPYPQQAFLVPGLRNTVDVILPPSPQERERRLAASRIPVNVTAAVHEVGDPSVFLAALAGAMQSAGSDYSKAVVASVLPPPGTQTLGQIVQKNNATVTAAVGSYYKDLAGYLKECGNPSLLTQVAEDAYLASMWSQITQDHTGAQQIAASFGTTSGLPAAMPPQPQCRVKGAK